MTKLVIEVANPATGADRLGPGAIGADLVGRAQQLLDADAKAPALAVRHDLLLPLGGAATELAVPPGLWSVELVLPSGELMNTQVEVREGAAVPVRFDLGPSPQAWLNWQFVEGSVPAGPQYEAALAGFDASEMAQSPRGVVQGSPDQAVALRVTKAMRDTYGAPVFTTDTFAAASRWTPKNRSQMPILRYRVPPAGGPMTFQQEFDRAAEGWSALVAGLRLEGEMLDIPGVEIDEALQFVGPQTDPWHDVWRLEGKVGDNDRHFAMVITNRAIEFASLPLPWPIPGIPGESAIELVIDKSGVARPSRSSITLKDPRFFGLLSYLKAGSLSLAARVADAGPEDGDLLVEVLRGKTLNPLGACAAAYALVGASDSNRAYGWTPWLANLSEWFPRIPDGAVAHARWLALSGTGDEAEIRRAYLRAFRRGLPFYALGLAWLLEGLRQFSDPHCEAAADLVRQVSLRSDVSQVFTVLSLHPPSEASKLETT